MAVIDYPTSTVAQIGNFANPGLTILFKLLLCDEALSLVGGTDDLARLCIDGLNPLQLPIVEQDEGHDFRQR